MLSGSSDGVPIRACATPDKVQLAQFALSVAEYILHYYDNYFGIKYPMPKLDMIALPDFEAGAMENFGSITYRETDLLIDEKTASISAKKVRRRGRGARDGASMVRRHGHHGVVGQHLAERRLRHLDGEQAARRMAAGVEHPPGRGARSSTGTLDFDAQATTRAIRAQRRHSRRDQRDVRRHRLRQGRRRLLHGRELSWRRDLPRRAFTTISQAHLYANATAEDFWNALKASSGKPVDKIMESLVVQPGEPLLTFGSKHNGKVEVTQKRFFLNPKDAEDQQTDQTQRWVCRCA